MFNIVIHCVYLYSPQPTTDLIVVSPFASIIPRLLLLKIYLSHCMSGDLSVCWFFNYLYSHILSCTTPPALLRVNLGIPDGEYKWELKSEKGRDRRQTVTDSGYNITRMYNSRRMIVVQATTQKRLGLGSDEHRERQRESLNRWNLFMWNTGYVEKPKFYGSTNSFT